MKNWWKRRTLKLRLTLWYAGATAVVLAVFAIYAALPLVALSALPVEGHGGHYSTLLGTSESHGLTKPNHVPSAFIHVYSGA